MPARSMIDIVGRAAERLDLNAPREPLKAEHARSQPPGLPDRLEPTILAAVAAESAHPAAPYQARTDAHMERTSFLDTFADTQGAPSHGTDAQRVHDANAQAATARATRTAAINSINLDWTALAKGGFLTPDTQNSVKAEEFRIIKRPLLRTAFGVESTRMAHGHVRSLGNTHVLMVTSPHQGDGKTFTALNLAVSMASERDLQVLLIDADIRSRGLSRTLGLEDRHGLTELLTQPHPVAETVTLRTDMPSLSIIPAGGTINGAAELLASQAMTNFVHDLARDKNRFVIFDAPPALMTSEPGVLAGHVGQVVMVARANDTSRRAIADALDTVNACASVSFILNQISRSAVPQRFGYYGAAAAE